MSYNLHDRYRRRSNERMMAFIVVLTILFLSFGFGFWIGGQTAEQQNRSLKANFDNLKLEKDKLQTMATELRAEAQTARARYEQLQSTYAEILPEGPMQELVLILKQQLDEGRDPSRLSFLIRSARPPRNCSEPETKRFIVSTPAYQGQHSEITIADGALVIKGTGASAVNASGNPEAWYDPSKKVTIEFTGQGGIKEVKEGIMPITHSLVVENREYRVSISEGARSFAKVSFDSCDYP
ncbi:MAG: hypothetical protein IT559_00890 [Alphaproteobacteria bacterium]|nr:hypothetical protein [Alphaproteobacteria bacterium]